jgi:branched-chain amino acid transport system substrate-binding protein
MEKPLVVLLLFFIPASFLMTCTKRDKIKIALMTKFESGSIIGSSEAGALNLYLEEKGIKNIELVYIDDGWDPVKAVQAYEDVKSRGIDILITSHISTCAVAIADMVNRDKVLTMVTGAVTDELSLKDDYIFRNIQDVEQEQKSIADYIKKNFPAHLLIVRDVDNYAYTGPALKNFIHYYRNNVTVVDVSMASIDFKLLEQKMKKAKFESLYLLIGGYKIGAGSIDQLARSINSSCPVMYTPWMNTPSIIETAGLSIKGSIMPSHYPSKNRYPALNSYLERFKKKYGYAPTFISLNVYTAFELLNMAIKKGAHNPDSIKKYFLDAGEIKSEFTSTEFNRWGDVEASLYFFPDIPGEF